MAVCGSATLFTGQRYEEASGLYDFHQRWYDADCGRFIGVDPLVQSAADPQTANAYGYVRNNPLVNVDPDGRFFGTGLGIAMALNLAGAVGVGVGADPDPGDTTQDPPDPPRKTAKELTLGESEGGGIRGSNFAGNPSLKQTFSAAGIDANGMQTVAGDIAADIAKDLKLDIRLAIKGVNSIVASAMAAAGSGGLQHASAINADQILSLLEAVYGGTEIALGAFAWKYSTEVLARAAGGAGVLGGFWGSIRLFNALDTNNHPAAIAAALTLMVGAATFLAPVSGTALVLSGGYFVIDSLGGIEAGIRWVID